MKSKTKEEFIESYCNKSNITKSQLLEFAVVKECNCGNNLCSGWGVFPKDKYYNQKLKKLKEEADKIVSE